MVAIAFTNDGRISAAEDRSTLARTSRSATSRSTRSPAREASAASSRAASMAWSSLGWSPTRPAEVRPGVEHDQHVAVPLGPPGPHHHRAWTGRCPASRWSGRRRRGRTPAGCRTRCPARAAGWSPGRPAPAAGPAGWAGACGRRTAAARGPSTAPRARPAARRRRSGPSARIDHRPGPPVAPPGRAQGQVEPAPLPGRDPHLLHPAAGARPTASRRRGRCRPDRRRPRLVSGQLGVRLLARAAPTCRRPGAPGPGRRGAEQRGRGRSTSTTTPVATSAAHQEPATATATTAAAASSAGPPGQDHARGRLSGGPGRWPGSTRSPSRW